jgi:hypothetical protein
MTICIDRYIEIKGAQRDGGTTFHTNMFEIYYKIRGLLEKYPTFGREKETGLLGALDT